MEEDVEIQVEDIEKIIEDEIEKVKNAELSKHSPENERQSEASYKIAMTIVDAIINDPIPFYFDRKTDNLLLGLIKRAKLDNQFSEHSFWTIEEKLKNELEKFEENTRPYSLLKSSIEHLNFIAVRYFEEYLVEEFKGVHIAEILIRTKSTLARLNENDDKYFRQAVLSIKKGIEERIELRKEEKLLRSQIYEPNEEISESEEKQHHTTKKSSPFINGFQEERGRQAAKNSLDFLINTEQTKIGEREQRQKELGLTIARATLFLDYLFKHSNIDCRNTEKAKVISFLTGYSEKQIAQTFSYLEKEKLEMKEKSELSDKFSKDIEIVRKYFKTLKIDEIQNQIDIDLELDFE